MDALPVGNGDFIRRYWQEVLHTESWFVQQALAGTWPAEPDDRRIWLVCRLNLDVYRGVAGQYTQRYGNLRHDSTDWVLSRAVADGACSYHKLWFTREQLVPVQQLAARLGDPHSQRINQARSLRYWWLECARRLGPISHQE